MNNVQVLNGLCGDEDPVYLFKVILEESISRKLKEAQGISCESNTDYFDLIAVIINSAWIETNA